MTEYLLNGEKTKRLLFRKVLPSDFDSWLPFHQDPRTSEFWQGLPPDPEIACQQQFDRVFERYAKGLGGMNALISKASGNLIGLCGLLVQTVDGVRELEIGYSILPQYWRRGYATEAARRCKEFAKTHKLTKSLISIIQVHNLPSQRVALAIGMHLDKTTVYHKNKVDIFRVQL